jgi:hypothetical protein
MCVKKRKDRQRQQQKETDRENVTTDTNQLASTHYSERAIKDAGLKRRLSGTIPLM